MHQPAYPGGPEDRHKTPGPRHVAIILDGNGRWVARHGGDRAAGHREGYQALLRAVACASRDGIQALTVYAFSTENWGRPQAEVEALMRRFQAALGQLVESLRNTDVRLRFLGRLAELPPGLQAALGQAAEATMANTGLALNVCFNYGGRAELVDAVRQLIADGREPDTITEGLISSSLYTRDLPDPDLIIRTGGEMRLSNFLLWQSAYSEFYATPTLWPDFRQEEWQAALASYRQRQRPFGKERTSFQIR